MSVRASSIAASLVAACVVVGALLAARGCDEASGERVAPRAGGASPPARTSATSTTAADAAHRPILRRGGRAATTTNATPAQSGTVPVRVVGAPDGAPIARATVSVPDFEDEGLDRRTDVDGVARFGPLEPTRWEFRASAPGRIAEYGTCVVVAGAETTLSFRLTPSVDLSIRVEDRRTGAAIADAKVRRLVVGATIGLDATTDAAGRCTLPSMPDAVVRVTATVDAFDGAETLARTSSRGASATDVILRLAPLGRMTGVVRAPDGTPVPKARVCVAPAADHLAPVVGGFRGIRGVDRGRNSMTQLDATADDDGRYVLTGLVHGRRYHACADDGGARFGASTAIENLISTPDAAELAQDFVLKPLGGLVVRVTKSDGTPVPNAGLWFNSGVAVSSLAADPNRPHSDGVFTYSGWNSGVVEFSISAPGVGYAHRRIVVPAGDTVDVTVVLGASSEIRGFVVDDAGRPIAGATVSTLSSVQVFMSRESRTFTFEGSKTDAGGAFRLTVGEPGPTTVDVEAVGHFKSAGVALTAPCDDARIVLRRAATLTFRVGGDDGTRLNATPFVFFDGLSSPAYARPDETGRVRYDFEPRGAVQAQIAAYGSAPVVVSANLVAGEVCDLGYVRLVKPRRIAGRVVDAAGRPIAGALVGADDHTGRLVLGTKKLLGTEETNGDGRFAGDWAPPSGPLPLFVEAAGFLPLHATVTIAGDAPVVLTLARGGLAWGEVVDAAGAPMPDVKIRFLDANGAEAATASANARGLFDVRLAPGRYVVRAESCDDVTIELREGGDEHVRLVGRSR